MPKSFGINPGGSGSGEIEVGVTPSDGTANVVLKTNASGEVADSTITDDGTNVTTPSKIRVTGGEFGRFIQMITNYVGQGSAAFAIEVISSVGQTALWLVNDTSAGEGIKLRVDSAVSAQFDGSSTAGNTRMLLYDVDNATLERVSVGAADSGGAGFKVLRIPN